MVQLWLGSVVKGACMVQGSVLLCCCYGQGSGRLVHIERQRGRGCLYRVNYK